MDKTLHDLGGIVLEGLPTFFLVLVLAFFVRILLLKPLERVLAERHRLTEGARKAAEESLRNADTRIAEYEAALNRARAEIYTEQARLLEKVRDEEAASLLTVRAEADELVANSRRSIAEEAAAARQKLAAQSDVLAGQIADSILRSRAA